MMQPIAGGAAARPFITHHNALDMPLYLRIAPELYLKRLLVGGLPRVFEINRNFRNEGIDRQHNPEFTMLELYEAFGDCWTVMEITESVIHEMALSVRGEMDDPPGDGVIVPFGEVSVDYSAPFARVHYGDLFQANVGCSMFDEDAVRAKATAEGLEDADKLDVWLVVNELFERFAEPAIDPAKPTFVTDFPAAISPLTRPQPQNPALSFRWELFIAGMEVANAYTELNDPDVQLAKFTEQLAGQDEEDAAFRAMDEDFINALRVGMPPAGGLGIGVDRIIMLMTNRPSIRDVILFPLMRPVGQEG
jgi:lysyl-tRNA synthetase class 2